MLLDSGAGGVVGAQGCSSSRMQKDVAGCSRM